MQLSKVKAKARRAYAKRESDIEQEEIEGGEINLIPYLDIVTNLMLFLLMSLSGLVMGNLNTQLPEKGPSQKDMKDPPELDPKDKPVRMVLSVTPTTAILWSISGLEGTLSDPAATADRTGQVGANCRTDAQCEQSACDYETYTCKTPDDEVEPIPVFDWTRVNAKLFEIAERRWKGKIRKPETYRIWLQADGSVPYGTIVAAMDSVRCTFPDADASDKMQAGEAPKCLFPSSDKVVKEHAEPSAIELAPRFDWERKEYTPTTDALFHDIIFSTRIQFELK
jgi:biopolymer transport protein ExbD